MLVMLEVEEQGEIVRCVEIEAGDDDTVEAAAVRLAAALDFELEEVLEDLAVNGQPLHRHHKVSHYGEHGYRWRHRHRRIRVVVFAPRSPEPKVFFWRKNLLVGEASKSAAKAFGYVGGNPGLQTESTPPLVLDNRKTLEAEHVHCGAKLELVDSGGGVNGSR
jgi:hypothetical protein